MRTHNFNFQQRRILCTFAKRFEFITHPRLPPPLYFLSFFSISSSPLLVRHTFGSVFLNTYFSLRNNLYTYTYIHLDPGENNAFILYKMKNVYILPVRINLLSHVTYLVKLFLSPVPPFPSISTVLQIVVHEDFFHREVAS